MNKPLPVINYLSDHFTLEEATVSETARELEINNTPDADTLKVMEKTAVKMEKVRNLLGDAPITVNSWYRSPELNVAIRGSKSSQHMKGEAVDFTCFSFGIPLEICKKLIENKDLINYDQLILEHTWVHISFAIRSGEPRGQVLSLLSSGGYATGLTDKSGKSYE